MTRRSFLSLFLGLPVLAGCRQGGNFSLFGYTTEPPFDPNIRTVYIPVFKLVAMVSNPYRGIDVDLTEAIVRELSSRKSPMRVTSDPSRADTELIGTIVNIQKNVVNRNPQNLDREAEIVISVDVIWRDLRTGDLLTNPTKPLSKTNTPANAFDPSVEPALPPPPNDKPVPVRIVSPGRLLPEVGESNATATQMALARLANQIVNMMEKNWNTH